MNIFIKSLKFKNNLFFNQKRFKIQLKTMNGETIFDKIIRKEIPAKICYEDDQSLAFHDINPQAPVHIILIPKKRDNLSRLFLAEEKNKEILGHLLYIASVIAKEQKLDEGFRIVINDGQNGGQTVSHLHIHILGGAQCFWPPGTPGPGGEGMPKKL